MDINREAQILRYLAVRSNEKECLQVLGGDALSSAQYVTLQKYFSHPSFTYLLNFSNPTQKTKTGTAKFQICRRLLIASICTNHVYYTLLQQMLSFDVLSTNLNKQTVKKCWAKSILLSQTGMFFTFLHTILICRVTYWALQELL